MEADKRFQTLSLKVLSQITHKPVIFDLLTSIRKGRSIWRYFPTQHHTDIIPSLVEFEGAAVTLNKDERDKEKVYMSWEVVIDGTIHHITAKQIGSIDLSRRPKDYLRSIVVERPGDPHKTNFADRYGVGPSFLIMSDSFDVKKAPSLMPIESKESGIVGIWKVVYDNKPI